MTPIIPIKNKMNHNIPNVLVIFPYEIQKSNMYFITKNITKLQPNISMILKIVEFGLNTNFSSTAVIKNHAKGSTIKIIAPLFESGACLSSDSNSLFRI